MSGIEDINWGFEPTGLNAGLGGESSPSAPGDADTGLGDPQEAWKIKHREFVLQTQRRYGDISDVKGSIWDPRGRAALSDEVADYKKSGFNAFKENRVLYDTFPGGDGMPVVQQWAEPTDVHLDALSSSNAALAPETAAQLARVIEKQDSSVASSIYLPQASDPTYADKHGFISSDGGLPESFINPSTGKLYQGLSTSIDAVVEGAAPSLQHIDENGVVDKYAPTTGPYDNYGSELPGGLPVSTRMPTPAEVQASPSLALDAAGAAVNADGMIVSPLDAQGGIAPTKLGFPWMIVLGAGTAFAGIMFARQGK